MEQNVGFLAVLAIAAPFVSAIVVALLNNWEKLNPNRKVLKDVLKTVSDTQQTAANNHKMAAETQADMVIVKAQLKNLSVAQRTGLQTMILEKCKKINNAIAKGDVSYEEELKQLIILYREYHSCGYNSQGKLYFNDTITKASEHDNVMVRELMNTYFADYEP